MHIIFQILFPAKVFKDRVRVLCIKGAQVDLLQLDNFPALQPGKDGMEQIGIQFLVELRFPLLGLPELPAVLLS